MPFAVDHSLHCRGCWPSFREQDRGTPPFALSFVEKIKIMSPLTYVEPYLGDITRRRRDGRGSSTSSYYEMNAVTNGSYQYFFSVHTPGNRQKSQVLPEHPRNPLGTRILTLVHLLYIT